MNKKITSSALAALMIAGSTSFSALAAMSNGTVVIGNKAFDLTYANDPAHAEEITNAIVAGGAVYVKDFEGNWIDNTTGKTVAASVIPAVVYKNAKGEVANFDAADKDSSATSFGVTAIGAKKLKVTFTSAVDSTKAVLSVKKGTVAVSVDKIEFATDKMSATVTTTTNLTKGDYTVSVTGLTETALTATVTAEDVKVSKINVLSQTAPMNSAAQAITLPNTNVISYGANQTAFVNYEVVNQYGEAMTGQTINWTQSTGGGVLDNTTDGQLTIGNTVAAGTNFIPGTKVFLTGVHVASGTVVNAEVVIGLESKVDVVTFKGVYNTVTSKVEALPAGFTNGKYVLLYEAKDQYGNEMSNPVQSDLVFTSNNPLFVSADTNAGAYASATDVTVDGVTYKAAALVAGSAVSKGGTVTIQVISKVTGKTSTYTVQADALGTVKTFSMSAPSAIVAEGEKIEIPFTAADQFGNAVTKYSALPTTGSSVAIQLSSGLAFEQQNDGSAKLFYTAGTGTGATDTNDAPVYLTSLISDGGSFSSLMLNVKKAAKPVAITGIDSAKVTSIAAGNKTDIYGKDLIVQDQYGRVMSDAKVEAWLGTTTDSTRIVVTSEKPSTDKSPFTVVTNGAATTADALSNSIDLKTEYFTVAAKDKTVTGLNATEKLVFGLSTDSGTTVPDASKKSITFTKVDQSNYVSFEAADLGTMYNDANATSTASIGFDKTLKVYGVKADGTKVLLPASDYSVTTDGKLVVNNNVITDVTTAGYIAGDFVDGTAYTDVKVNVLVTVNDTNGAAASIIEKELLVSNKAPKVTTIAVDTDNVTDGKATINSGVITNAQLNAFIDTTELRDQYGVVITEVPVITVTNLSKVDDSTLTVASNGTNAVNMTGAKMGDKFTATYKYASGKTVVIVFTVGL